MTIKVLNTVRCAMMFMEEEHIRNVQIILEEMMGVMGLEKQDIVKNVCQQINNILAKTNNWMSI